MTPKDGFVCFERNMRALYNRRCACAFFDRYPRPSSCRLQSLLETFAEFSSANTML